MEELWHDHSEIEVYLLKIFKELLFNTTPVYAVYGFVLVI